MKTALRRIVAAMIAILSISLLAAPRAEARKTLRILAVGNSFSDDAMEYLPALLESMGIDDVELARLYVGGCSLEQHLRFHVGGESRYEFYRSAAGENRWVKSKERVSLRDALFARRMGHNHLTAGIGLLGPLRELPALPRRPDGHHSGRAAPSRSWTWHMTWSYSTDSTHGQFADYGRDRRRMYDAICSAVRETRAAYFGRSRRSFPRERR